MRKTLILVVLALLLVNIGFSATVPDEVAGGVSKFGIKIWDTLKAIYNFFSGGITGFVAYTGKFNTTTNQTYGEIPVSNGMAGYWKLNNNANDETGNNNDGVVNGATPTTDCVFGTGNCAYDFNGAGDYISVADDNTLDLTTDFTIEFWVKTSSGSQSGIIDKTDESGAQNFWGYSIWMTAGGNIYYYNNGGGWQTSSGTINDGSWHHIAATLTGGSGCIYIDGNCDTVISGSANSNTLPLLISSGRLGDNSPGSFLDGVVDQIIIYNRSLSATEVNESYTRGIATTTLNKITNLTIWDTTDDSPALVNEQIYVYANYTGNDEPINNSAGSCTVDLAGPMEYDYDLNLYFLNGSVPAESETDYTINCSSADYAALNVSDHLSVVSVRLNITNVIYYARTKSSVKINWTTNIPGNSTVKYGKTKSLNMSASSATKTTKHSISLTGLTNGTKYYYNVTSYNSSYKYAVSGPRNFTTKRNDNIPAISGRTATVLNSESVRITWNSSEPANGTVMYSTSSTNLTSKTSSASYTLNKSIVISGLNDDTTYYYKIKLCDADGDCSTEGTYSFKTLEITQAPSALNVPGVEAGIQLPTITPVTLTDEAHETSLTPGGRFIFNVDGARHEMKILNIYIDSVTIQFSSYITNLTFQKGETKKVDLDNNSVYDISVTIKDIVTTKVVFIISKIAEEGMPKIITPAEEGVTEEAVEEVPARIVEIREAPSLMDKLKLPLLILASLLMAVIIGVGGYFGYQKTVTVEIKEAITLEEREKISKLPKPQLEIIMNDIYAMIKKKESDDKIKSYLEGVKLSKNVVEAIMYEMRKEYNKLDRLILYSKLQKVRGKPLSEIKKKLIKADWAEEIIKLLE